jgi:hypothetical protein
MLINWGIEFARARQRLLECADFETQQRVGHQLKEGAVLTSISYVPFEMSFKCALCGVIFWFENVAWRWGGAARWRLTEESRRVQGCVGHGARVWSGTEDRFAEQSPQGRVGGVAVRTVRDSG